jgi:chromosome segregation ATPase
MVEDFTVRNQALMTRVENFESSSEDVRRSKQSTSEDILRMEEQNTELKERIAELQEKITGLQEKITELEAREKTSQDVKQFRRICRRPAALHLETKRHSNTSELPRSEKEKMLRGTLRNR